MRLAKYRVVGVVAKSGSEAAALQIASSQYYAGLSSLALCWLVRTTWGAIRISGVLLKLQEHSEIIHVFIYEAL